MRKAIALSTPDEKFDKLFKLVNSTQELLLMLKQRVEVDEQVIAVLLAESHDPKGTLQRWQEHVARYYPGRSVNNIGDDLPLSQRMLREQVDYWTRALEQHAQDSDGS